MTTIILGIDPGTNITGYGIVELSNEGSLKYIHHEIIKTGLKNKYTKKLSVIFQTTQKIIEKFNPNHVAIESVFFSVNAGTAIKLGQARGAAICACGNHELNIYEYSPRKVKLILTDNGASDKIELQRNVKKTLNIRRELEIDASDALAVAICHAIIFNEDKNNTNSI
ncbi:MAG: crossover junction endodeoxyribonuclease RuvC [Gammaproteobacteria bacterium]|nr:crossover junction endodeoxyribonuclease RuvC [Gammaproteobacteria bacterium]|tara:strand:- start:104 stop:607 length:504 start_codon:yes stop_codon:yes gene_type:complete